MRKQQAEAVRTLQRLREVAAVDSAEALSVARGVVHTYYGEGLWGWGEGLHIRGVCDGRGLYVCGVCGGEGLYICGGVGAAFYCKVLIAEELPAEGVALKSGEAFHFGETLLLREARIDEEVVVAQDTDHAIGGMETAEDAGIRLRFRYAHRDKVARETDEVRLQGVDGVHDPLQSRRAVVESGEVQVADMYHSVAVEGSGEVAARIVGAVYPQAETPEKATVRHHEPQGKDKGEGSPTKGSIRWCGQVEQARDCPPDAKDDVRQGTNYGSKNECHCQGDEKYLHTIRENN